MRIPRWQATGSSFASAILKVPAMSESSLIKAHAHSSVNQGELMESTLCGCFYCLATFPPHDIEEWIDDQLVDGCEGKTALCPHCGIDSVIGSNSGFPLAREFLTQMKAHWF